MADHEYQGVHLDFDPAEAIHVYLLGTGSPSLSTSRHGICTLIRAGGQWLLFDLGRGALQRMYEAGVPVPELNRVFLTHLHSDHICGFPDFWMTGWFVLHREHPIEVHGPEGTARFIDGMREMHHFDLAIRPRYETAAADGRDLRVHEFAEGVVFERDGLKVSAFLVDHGPVKPAYGFRVDWNGRSVVLSGDTTICEGVMRNAEGCDLLIHEIGAASRRQLDGNEITRRIMSIHTSPEQMAQVCARSRPRLTLLNHVSVWRVTQYDILDRVRAGYDGAVEMALDRMEVLVGPQIRIFPPGPPRTGQDLIVSDRKREAP